MSAEQWDQMADVSGTEGDVVVCLSRAARASVSSAVPEHFLSKTAMPLLLSFFFFHDSGSAGAGRTVDARLTIVYATHVR